MEAKYLLFPAAAQMAWFQVEEMGREEEEEERWERERRKRGEKERETTVPPLSTTIPEQTLDRSSATLLNIIMLKFGKCG
jgi:hypothetical protein